MSQEHFGESYGGNPAENYERFFVPVIGEPLARKLVRDAGIQNGERILDVACGTGIVARLAAEQVDGSSGTVAAVDVNPGMIAVAQTTVKPEYSIEWHQASAEEMPLPDDAFDVVFCQMGLQFMPDKAGALSEMRRVASPGGRVIVSVPGPSSEVFTVLAGALERNIGPEAAGFVRQVFSLYDPEEITQLMGEAGLSDIEIESSVEDLSLPPGDRFLWEYVWSTPLAGIIAQADESARGALEREVVEAWEKSEENGVLRSSQPVVVATARK